MNILLAVDGSRFSEAAIRVLASRIRPEDVEVLVLQVVEPRVFSTPPQMALGYEPEQAEFLKEKFKQAQISVDEAGRQLRDAGFEVKTRVVEADTRLGILDIAEEQSADLIVLGSHGRKGLQRLLLGSVAENVARSAKCSVMIVRVPGKA